MRILHISPHADDEALGCPATLAGLTRFHEVNNLLLRAESARRENEARAASLKSGIPLLRPKQDPPIGSRANPRLADIQAALPAPNEYDIWISPHPEDAHPAHEQVARAIEEFLPKGSIWWQWGLWRELPRANLLYAFGEKEMKACQQVLGCYKGENSRNNYPRLLRGRAEALAVLAPERLWGWGSKKIDEPYAEVLLEVRRQEKGWTQSPPRRLDLRAPL